MEKGCRIRKRISSGFLLITLTIPLTPIMFLPAVTISLADWKGRPNGPPYNAECELLLSTPIAQTLKVDPDPLGDGGSISAPNRTFIVNRPIDILKDAELICPNRDKFVRSEFGKNQIPLECRNAKEKAGLKMGDGSSSGLALDDLFSGNSGPEGFFESMFLDSENYNVCRDIFVGDGENLNFPQFLTGIEPMTDAEIRWSYDERISEAMVLDQLSEFSSGSKEDEEMRNFIIQEHKNQKSKRWPSGPLNFDTVQRKMARVFSKIKSWNYCHALPEAKTEDGKVSRLAGQFRPDDVDIWLYRSACAEPLNQASEIHGYPIRKFNMGLRYYLIAAHELGHVIDYLAERLFLLVLETEDPLLKLTNEQRANLMGAYLSECGSRLWQRSVQFLMDIDREYRAHRFCMISYWQTLEKHFADFRQVVRENKKQNHYINKTGVFGCFEEVAVPHSLQ